MDKRILLLADTASSHTEKWATGMAAKGFKVGLFSLNKSTFDWHRHHKHIFLLHEPGETPDTRRLGSKLSYLLLLPKLKRAIREFRPDVLHAHYASSYGLLGALCGFRPFFISAWGSDIFDFPKKSIFHQRLLKYTLSRADRLLCTSYALKGELWHYTHEDVQIIPFGVNTKLFYPEATAQRKEEVTVGTIKAMEEIYGIPTILKAIQIIRERKPPIKLRFMLIGGGSQLANYKQLAQAMGLEDQVVFTGKIPFREIPRYHNLLDIFLNVSTVNESFGVSVIEAMACQKPVIVTDASGLREIVNDDPRLGAVVEKKNARQLADAILHLALSPALRQKMGEAGRWHVLENYDFAKSLDQMTTLYNSFLNRPAPNRYTQLAQPKEPVL